MAITFQTTRAPETKRQRVARWMASGVALFLALSPISFYATMILGLAWQMGDCETVIGDSIEVVPAYKFQFRGTLCSGFGASYTIDMVGLDRGPETETVLFSYSPSDDSTPQILAIAPNRIRVSIDEVSQVRQRLEKWRDLEIEYDIGRVVYPADRPKAN